MFQAKKPPEKSEAYKILEMVEKGMISVDEAERLLLSLNEDRTKPPAQTEEEASEQQKASEDAHTQAPQEEAEEPAGSGGEKSKPHFNYQNPAEFARDVEQYVNQIVEKTVRGIESMFSGKNRGGWGNSGWGNGAWQQKQSYHPGFTPQENENLARFGIAKWNEDPEK